MKELKGVIFIDYPEKDYYLYTMQSSIKDDKSIYIGVTHNPIDRWKKHAGDRRRKPYKNKPVYKWMNDVIDNRNEKIYFKIVEKDLPETEAFSKEIDLILFYKGQGYNVLNISEGGKGFKGCKPWNKREFTDEHKNKLSIAHMGNMGGMCGKKHTKETKELLSRQSLERKHRNWQNPRKKIVYKYDRKGNLLNTYSSLGHASIEENVSPSSVGEWCRGEKKPMNGFIYSYTKLN